MGTLVVGIPVAMSFAAKQVVDTARIELSEPMEIGAFMASVKGRVFDEMILESTFEFDGDNNTDDYKQRSQVGFQNSSFYCYRLRAKNDLGYSLYSNTACATTN